MSLALVLLLVFCIGIAGGLRSMTPLAAVVWAAHLHWIHLLASPFAFFESRWALWIFTAFALMEFVADLLPFVHARIAAFPLTARIVVGFLAGASLALSAGFSPWLAGTDGVAGALLGAFGGYHLRKSLVQSLHVPDALIAIPEDFVAIALAWIAVSRFA